MIASTPAGINAHCHPLFRVRQQVHQPERRGQTQEEHPNPGLILHEGRRNDHDRQADQGSARDDGPPELAPDRVDDPEAQADRAEEQRAASLAQEVAEGDEPGQPQQREARDHRPPVPLQVGREHPQENQAGCPEQHPPDQIPDDVEIEQVEVLQQEQQAENHEQDAETDVTLGASS